VLDLERSLAATPLGGQTLPVLSVFRAITMTQQGLKELLPNKF